MIAVGVAGFSISVVHSFKGQIRGTNYSMRIIKESRFEIVLMPSSCSLSAGGYLCCLYCFIIVKTVALNTYSHM